jgi:hypothetical protein
MRQRMAGLSYSSKGRKFTKQYELLSIEGLRSKVALQKLFQFPGTHYTHSTTEWVVLYVNCIVKVVA